MRLNLVPANTSLPFVHYRGWSYMLSCGLVVISLLFVVMQGLNFGIDFRGGILIEVQTDGPADLADLRGRLAALDLGEVSLQTFGAPDDVLIRVQRQTGDEGAQAAAIASIKAAIADVVTEDRRTEFVGPQVGEELQWAATLAMLCAIGGMLVYITLRFEWQFGVAAVIALVHDVVVTLGFLAIMGIEFGLPTVAALLAVAGYSINDTVVVFDRVREELQRYKKMPLDELCNLAVNRTLSRTVLTSGTTLLAILALMIFGGAVIRDFVAAFLVGVLIGTYSSIFLATPLLLNFGLNRSFDTDAAPPGMQADPDASA